MVCSGHISIFMNIPFLSKRCDADPAALSKYVLALIKKDKPLDDLKESMSQQMDVFLQVSSIIIQLNTVNLFY